MILSNESFYLAIIIINDIIVYVLKKDNKVNQECYCIKCLKIENVVSISSAEIDITDESCLNVKHKRDTQIKPSFRGLAIIIIVFWCCVSVIYNIF